MKASKTIGLGISLSFLAASLTGCGPESDDSGAPAPLEMPQQAQQAQQAEAGLAATGDSEEDLYFPYPYPPRLFVKRANQYTWIYDDRGSGADRDVSVWRVNLSQYPGYYALGDVAVSSYGSPSVETLVVREYPSGGLLARPAGYTQIWNDKGSGGDHDGSFWKPLPYPGYTCLGTVTVRGYTMPSTDLIRCVRSEFVTQAYAQQVWTDRGSGADRDVSLFRAVPRNLYGLPAYTFIAQPNYSSPNPSDYWVLDYFSVEW